MHVLIVYLKLNVCDCLVLQEHLQFGKQSISGPLIFKSGKIDEILQRNESNIRQAVRKSHLQRGKNKLMTRE